MDLAPINEAIGLASSAIGATGKAADTIAAFKNLFEGGNQPETDEATKLLNTLAAELTAANIMNVQISSALKDLNSELAKHNEFETLKARYELFETSTKDIVFKLKDSEVGPEPEHFICPVCLNNGRIISYLSGGEYDRFCQTDRKHIYAFKEQSRSPAKRRASTY